MPDQKQTPDMIPEHFASMEAAVDFWDLHDLADYADQTEEVTFTVNLLRQYHLVALDPDIYDMQDMRFDWDPYKAMRNLRRHGVSFEEAATVMKVESKK